jgi:hypothetical protein
MFQALDLILIPKERVPNDSGETVFYSEIYIPNISQGLKNKHRGLEVWLKW